jgi:hypothetical protein
LCDRLKHPSPQCVGTSGQPLGARISHLVLFRALAITGSGHGPGRMPRIATRTPEQGAGSVRATREFILAALRRWGAAERGEDIAVMVSELLTNALRHTLPALGDARPRRSIRLGLLQSGPRVLCAVADPRTATLAPLMPGRWPSTATGSTSSARSVTGGATRP